MVINIKNLSKVYGNGETRVNALKQVSLSIKKGEFIAISGASGCGKSTLLHMIGAMISPDTGEILLEGENIGEMKSGRLSRVRLKKIGFIFQTFNLIPTLTAYENVMLPMKLTNTPHKTARERSIRLLTQLGLSDRLHHVPSELSGGQKQRVAIARALANNPSVILADEPTGNLDSKNGEIILDLLQTLHEDGHTIIMVTHDQKVAAKADRVIYMKDGEFINEAEELQGCLS